MVNSENSSQSVRVSSQRVWDRPGREGQWLVSVGPVLPNHRRARGTDDSGLSLDCMPQCWCVVDDFGDLVPVRGWL